MAEIDPLLFALAVAGLLGAHAIRAVRWALLYPAESVGRFNLLLGLTLGYVVNALLPWRLGELVRAFFVWRREGVRLSFVAATIAAERLSDLVVIGAGGLVFAAATGMGGLVVPALLMLAAAALLVALGLGVHRSERMRRTAWAATWVFNEKVRLALCDLLWSFGEMLGPRGLLLPSYLLGTVSMWAGYFASFALFAAAIGAPFLGVAATLFGAPLQPLAFRIVGGEAGPADLALLAFVVLPLGLILGLGALRRKLRLPELVDATKGWAGFRETPVVELPSAQRFKSRPEYDYFLMALFSGDDQKTSSFGLRATDDARIHRFFQGGSDAVTALVEVGGQLKIRKFAQGAPADRLEDQARWLAAERGRGLPLVEVAATRREGACFVYDMPALAPAADLYDVIHTSPIAETEALLGRLLTATVAFHEAGATGPADEAAIARYLDTKVAENAARVLAFARETFPEGRVAINREPHDLAEWDRFADPAWLRAQITDTRTARIHGDLTVENVIVSPVVPTGYFVIDPNPDNIFNTPLIDWAKLMQSLHLGYEGLNRGVQIGVEAGAVGLSLVRSQAYSRLHDSYEGFLRDRLGEDGLREVYFHELVNYLRLTPYKIRQDPRKGLAFFACTAVLTRRYAERFG